MKWILVTGATRGLGLAVATRLVDEGYSVIAVGRKPSESLTELIASHPSNVCFEAFDFANIDQLHDFASGIIKRYGTPFGLVNNAAIGKDGVLGTQHEKDIEILVRVNVLAPIVLTKYISRSMMVVGEGRIINISSIIANTGFSGLSVYGATKASMIGFTKSLARELGKRNITVNAVLPGYMETGMTAALQGEKLASIVRRSPLRKLASVTEVAGSIIYLLGPDATAITGTTLTIDAGSTA